MEKFITATGKTIDLAIAAALEELHMDRDNVSVEVLENPRSGFLGIGANEHPVPWKKLRYDSDIRGFVTDITHEQLTGAPSLTETWFDDRDYHRRSYDHYGVRPYWL